MLLLFFACQRFPTECPTGENQIFLMEELSYVRANDGISKGFNLDQHSSTQDDIVGCHHLDYTAPDGTTGIVNNFSLLIEPLAATEAEDIEYSFTEAIGDGLLLLLLSIRGIDDSENDTCVEAQLFYGEGEPYRSSSGELLDGQTFSKLSEAPHSPNVITEIKDGILQMQDLNIRIQSEIMSILVELNLQSAELSLDFSQEPPQGIFAGGLPIEESLILTQFDQVGFTEELDYILTSAADLSLTENNTCDAISTSFSFSTLNAHFYGE